MFIDRGHPHLLSTLHKFGFIRYTAEHVAQRIAEIEDQWMLDRGLEVIDMSPEDRTSFLVENASQLPQIWKELQTIERITKSTTRTLEEVLEDKDYTVRLKLAEAKKKPEVINHLLAELDPTNIERLYHANRNRVVADFPSLPINKKRYIAYKALESTGGK